MVLRYSSRATASKLGTSTELVSGSETTGESTRSPLLRSAASSVEARLSRTAFTASWASTLRARWMPPFRSRPRRIPLYQIEIPQSAVMKTTRASFHFRSARMTSLPCLFCLLQLRHGAARNVDLHVGGDLQLDDLVGDARHHAVNPPRGDHLVAVLQAVDHRLQRLLLLVGRTDQEEVEDDEDEPHRHEEGEQRIGSLGARGLQAEDERATSGRQRVYHAAASITLCMSCAEDRTECRSPWQMSSL